MATLKQVTDIPTLTAGYGQYVPLINPSDFSSHAFSLLVLGFILVIAFVSYEVAHTTIKSRSIVKEFTLASGASILLGTGTLLAMLGAGLYV